MMGAMRTLIFLLIALHASAQEQAAHKLPATPKTIAWGHYSANTLPVRRIHSGETGEIETLITNSPVGLETAGVAPPSGMGRISSAPPWFHAGNPDNKEFVAGTILHIPVHARRALFQAGDGHAGQGNGEVTITALERSLVGVFQFVVHKDLHLRWPRGETPAHYITMGLHEDLRVATTLAVEEMIDFLVTEKHLSRDDAYMLTSVAADLSITQLVDGNKGVHAMIPKSIFR
jgi:acetamidase/formamidase